MKKPDKNVCDEGGGEVGGLAMSVDSPTSVALKIDCH